MTSWSALASQVGKPKLSGVGGSNADKKKITLIVEGLGQIILWGHTANCTLPYLSGTSHPEMPTCMNYAKVLFVLLEKTQLCDRIPFVLSRANAAATNIYGAHSLVNPLPHLVSTTSLGKNPSQPHFIENKTETQGGYQGNIHQVPQKKW